MFTRSGVDKQSVRIAERLIEHDNETHHERRDGNRIKASEPASVSGVHSRLLCDATITDVSTRGMKLTASKEFPVGTTVIVEWSGGFVPSRVRHSRQSGDMWVIGVEVECLPGVIQLLAELKKSAQQRNRSLLLPARICA